VLHEYEVSAALENRRISISAALSEDGQLAAARTKIERSVAAKTERID
jgi:hypothetical protein